VVAEGDVLPAAAAVDREAGVLALEGVILHRLGADKVRHRLLAGGAERVVRRLGWLEQHIAVAVAVQLASRLARRRNVVALLGVHLGDGGDRVRPELLRRQHLRLRHRRRRRNVRHRRVVQADAHDAILAPLVAEGVLDAHLVARGRVGEDVVAHRLRSRAVEVDLVVAEGDVLPAAAAVDREAGVLALEGVILHRLGADKVRHRLLAGGAERVVRRLGWLEQHIAVAVAVQLASRLARRRNVVALLGVHLGDGGDRVGPELLRGDDFRLGHVAFANLGRRGTLAVEERLDKANGSAANHRTANGRRQDHDRLRRAGDRRVAHDGRGGHGAAVRRRKRRHEGAGRHGEEHHC